MISVQLPAVVTVDKTEFEPRYPTLKSKMAARKKEIKELTFADLESMSFHIKGETSVDGRAERAARLWREYESLS